MPRSDTLNPVPLEKRQEIFLAVVEAQDQGLSVEDARDHTAKLFAVTPAQVKAIESEGVDNEWPPLS